LGALAAEPPPEGAELLGGVLNVRREKHDGHVPRDHEETVVRRGPTHAKSGTIRLAVSYRGESRLDTFLAPGAGARLGDPDKLRRALSQLRKVYKFIRVESGQGLELFLKGRFREILHAVIQENLRPQLEAAERRRLGYVEGLQDDLLQPLTGQVKGLVSGMFPEIGEVWSRRSPRSSRLFPR